jgi:hypothetical protein
MKETRRRRKVGSTTGRRKESTTTKAKPWTYPGGPVAVSHRHSTPACCCNATRTCDPETRIEKGQQERVCFVRFSQIPFPRFNLYFFIFKKLR